MAIVINGSGTVTGLAVGGLPDGTVDDGTVASGIASSKLTGALPAISGASLTGFTDAQMPAGSVVQVDSVILDTALNMSTATFTDLGESLTFTPRFANSKLLISLSSHVYFNANTTSWEAANHRVLRDSAVVTGSDAATDYGLAMLTDDGADTTMLMFSKHYFDSPGSTAAIVYKPQASSRSATAIRFNQYAKGIFTIMEIKQ